jgi:hypothetical protein
MQNLKNKLLNVEHFKSKLMNLTYFSLLLGLINSNLHMNVYIIINFVILILITKFYELNTNHCIKLVFQLSLLGLVIDKVKQIIISLFYLQNLYLGNEYWLEIQTQITLYYYVNIAETIINITFLFFCYFYYKEKHSINNCLSELMRIEYYDFDSKDISKEEN